MLCFILLLLVSVLPLITAMPGGAAPYRVSTQAESWTVNRAVLHQESYGSVAMIRYHGDVGIKLSSSLLTLKSDVEDYQTVGAHIGSALNEEGAVDFSYAKTNSSAKSIREEFGVTTETKTEMTKESFSIGCSVLFGDSLYLGGLVRNVTVKEEVSAASGNQTGKTSYVTYEPQILLHKGIWELELRYTPTISVEETNVSDSETGTLSLLAGLLTERFYLGLRLTHNRNEKVDNGTHNTLSLGVLAEFGLEFMRLGGGVRYDPASYEDSASLSPSNIELITAHVYGDIDLVDGLELQVALAKEVGGTDRDDYFGAQVEVYSQATLVLVGLGWRG